MWRCQRIFHFVRKATQRRGQRRNGRQWLGQHMHFQQQPVAKRRQHDIRGNVPTFGGNQRHVPSLSNALIDDDLVDLCQRIRIGEQRRQRQADGTSQA